MEYPMTSLELLRELREVGLPGQELLAWDCGMQGSASCIGVLLETKRGEATALWVTEGLCEASQACFGGHPIALRAQFSWGTKEQTWATKVELDLGDGGSLDPIGSLYLAEGPGLGVMAWSAPDGQSGWRAWKPTGTNELIHPGADQLPRFQGAPAKTLLDPAALVLAQSNKRTVQGGEWDHRPALSTALNSITMLSQYLEGTRSGLEAEAGRKSLENQAVHLLSAMSTLGADLRKGRIAGK
jgi:hypothetical protein